MPERLGRFHWLPNPCVDMYTTTKVQDTDEELVAPPSTCAARKHTKNKTRAPGDKYPLQPYDGVRARSTATPGTSDPITQKTTRKYQTRIRRFNQKATQKTILEHKSKNIRTATGHRHAIGHPKRKRKRNNAETLNMDRRKHAKSQPVVTRYVVSNWKLNSRLHTHGGFPTVTRVFSIPKSSRV